MYIGSINDLREYELPGLVKYDDLLQGLFRALPTVLEILFNSKVVISKQTIACSVYVH